MGVGGSLSTFAKAVNGWRADKSANDTTDVPATTSTEIVEDRSSVLDTGLSAIAHALSSMRDSVFTEIDRAVADERKKSDRMRTDEREAHEKAVSTLCAEIEEIRSENATLADESQAEADRADKAETTVSAREQQIEKLDNEVADLKTMLEQAAVFQAQVEELTASSDDFKSSTNIRIATADASAKAVQTALAKAEKELVDERSKNCEQSIKL